MTSKEEAWIEYKKKEYDFIGKISEQAFYAGWDARDGLVEREEKNKSRVVFGGVLE